MNLERNPNGALEITRKLFGAWHKTMKISSGGLEIKETKTLTSTPVTQSTTSWNLSVISYCVTAGSTNSTSYWLHVPSALFIYYFYKRDTIQKVWPPPCLTHPKKKKTTTLIVGLGAMSVSITFILSFLFLC